MKLFFTRTSPYSRKVRLVIREKGLENRIEEIQVDPYQDDTELQTVNPLGKVPALLLDDGEPLFDSPVICQYLDALTDAHPLVPAADPERWAALRWEALADGITDAAYNLVMEGRRPEQEQSSSWISRWTREIRRALAHCEQRTVELEAGPGLASLAMGAAIGYLEFRLPELLREAERTEKLAFSQLHDWYRAFATRPSMLATRPDQPQ